VIPQTIVALSKDPSFDAVQLKSEAAPDAAAAAGALEGYVFDLTVRYTPVGASR
jgi:hypothetical protein